jgi:hypothetical protein
VACSAALTGFVVGDLHRLRLTHSTLFIQSADDQRARVHDVQIRECRYRGTRDSCQRRQQARGDMWMHGILGIAEPGTCKSKTSCNSMRLPAGLVPVHAQLYRGWKVDC